jgi:hypothetical protein
LQLLQFFTGFKANGLARRNRDLRTRAGISTDAGFPRPNIEDSEAAQLDSFSVAKCTLHAFKNGLYGHLGFRLGDAGPSHNFIYDVEFYQPVLPLNTRKDSEPDTAGTPST